MVAVAAAVVMAAAAAFPLKFYYTICARIAYRFVVFVILLINIFPLEWREIGCEGGDERGYRGTAAGAGAGEGRQAAENISYFHRVLILTLLSSGAFMYNSYGM